jgi:hypothetical protein
VSEFQEQLVGAFSIFLGMAVIFVGGPLVLIAIGRAMNQLDRKPPVKLWQNRAEKRRYQKANDSKTDKIAK